MTKRSKTLGQNLILFAGSIFFAMLLAEIALRMVLPAPIVWKMPQDNYLYDPEIGHWLEPNQKAFTHDKVVITNSIGIRDSEYEPQAPDNVYRILALGDSQTFGNGLSLADTWPKQLESILNENTDGALVEVLNCGLPASDTWQHEIIFHRMIAKYNPDATILAFYVNDVVARHTPKPARHDTGNTLRSRIGYILKQSALLLTLRETLRSVRMELRQGKQPSNTEALLKGISHGEVDKGWSQVEQSLSEIKQTAGEANIQFLLASLPRRDQVYGSMPADAYNSRLQAIADKHHVPLINMLAPLQQSYEEHRNSLFIPWDGHNSAIANRVIAEELATAISSHIHGGR